MDFFLAFLRNSGGVPVISSAWERVLATQCQDAKAAALDIYDEETKTKLTSYPIPEDILIYTHNKAKSAAKNAFWSKISARDDSKAIETAKKLKDELRMKLISHKKENLEASQKESEKYFSIVMETAAFLYLAPTWPKLFPFRLRIFQPASGLLLVCIVFQK